MRRGTTALEFAIAGPLLVGLMLFMIGTAMALWTVVALHAVAVSAARCGALGLAGAPACPNATAARDQAVANARAWQPFATVTAGSVTVDAAATSCLGATGNFYTVSISATLPSALTPPFGGRSVGVAACFPRPSS